MPHQFEMVRAAIVKVVMAEIVFGNVPEVLASGVLTPRALVFPAMVVSLIVYLAAVAGGGFLTASCARIAGRRSGPALLA
jgi:hypothetical protein